VRSNRAGMPRSRAGATGRTGPVRSIVQGPRGDHVRCAPVLPCQPPPILKGATGGSNDEHDPRAVLDRTTGACRHDRSTPRERHELTIRPLLICCPHGRVVARGPRRCVSCRGMACDGRPAFPTFLNPPFPSTQRAVLLFDSVPSRPMKRIDFRRGGFQPGCQHQTD